MSNPIKQLVSETAIYGLTHTLSRFINVLLVPFYTFIFTPNHYGNMNVFYGAASIALVLISAGMETAFFNFSRKSNSPKVYSTALISVIVYGSFALLLFLSLANPIASWLGYPGQSDYVRIFALILAIDAVVSIPMAWLRNEHKAITFGKIKLLQVLANITFNVLFLVVIRIYFPDYYQEDFIIGYVFLSNLMATGLSLILTFPYFKDIGHGFDREIWKEMTAYAWPLIFVGLAGVINENLDRVMLKKLLPDSQTADTDIGVYTAFYKLGLVITIFVQAFRYAAEPFFFKEAAEKNAKNTYALVLRYFTFGCSLIFLVTALFAKQIAPFLITREEYFAHPQGFYVVPFILLAALFLGMIYNVNIWYKLSGKTQIGMFISLGGAAITIVLNFVLIPILGILGSAVTTTTVYMLMFFATFLLGKRHYPVPYKTRIIGFYVVLATALVALHYALGQKLIFSIIFTFLFIGATYWVEKNAVHKFIGWLKTRMSK
jgi:O-antigen/teichoic acid export membrane protein